MIRRRPEPVTSENAIVVAKGEDPRVLVIAFTGFGGRLGPGPYDFMALTRALAYSRVLVRDPCRVWYHRGLGGDVSSFVDLTQRLQLHARELGPETIITIGNSSGGYAALLAGHLLKADYAHALAPQTYLDAVNILRHRDASLVRGHWRDLLRLHRTRSGTPAFLDLRRTLSEDNGKTRYFVHVSADCDRDRRRAEHLTGLPRLRILRYPGDRHQVAGVMARHGFLRQILRPEIQDQLEALHRRRFETHGTVGERPPTRRGRRETIVAVIQQAGLREVGRAEIETSMDLEAELGLDSVAWLEILLGLENEFRVRIDHALVSEEDLRSVDSLDGLVRRSTPR
jgi:acyl carrier protein